MELFYKSVFRKYVKKQPRPFQLVVEDEIEKVYKNPTIGEEKSGDLAGFRTHKFTFRRQEYLMAYREQGGSTAAYMIDTHENFYKNLKRYVREVE
jgi:hypothetical protein